MGTALDGQQVTAIREALAWLLARTGTAVDRVAQGNGARADSLRNSVYHPDQRPDNALLGKLARYLGRNADLLPSACLFGGVQDALRRA